MRVIEVNMERRRNEGAGETGDPRVNPPTNGIVRHDSHFKQAEIRLLCRARCNHGRPLNANFAASAASASGLGSLQKPSLTPHHSLANPSPLSPRHRSPLISSENKTKPRHCYAASGHAAPASRLSSAGSLLAMRACRPEYCNRRRKKGKSDTPRKDKRENGTASRKNFIFTRAIKTSLLHIYLYARRVCFCHVYNQQCVMSLQSGDRILTNGTPIFGTRADRPNHNTRNPLRRGGKPWSLLVNTRPILRPQARRALPFVFGRRDKDARRWRVPTAVWEAMLDATRNILQHFNTQFNYATYTSVSVNIEVWCDNRPRSSSTRLLLELVARTQDNSVPFLDRGATVVEWLDRWPLTKVNRVQFPEPMRVIEVSMEQRRNESAGETGEPRDKPPTNGIVRHDSHMGKSGNSPFLNLPNEEVIVDVMVQIRIGTLLHMRYSNLSQDKDTLIVAPLILSMWVTVAEQLAYSPLTKAIRPQSPAGSLRTFACGNRAGRCRWPAGFLDDLPFPPFHSGAARYSPQSPSSALKTSLLRAARISSLTTCRIRALTRETYQGPNTFLLHLLFTSPFLVTRLFSSHTTERSNVKRYALVVYFAVLNFKDKDREQGSSVQRNTENKKKKGYDDDRLKYREHTHHGENTAHQFRALRVKAMKGIIAPITTGLIGLRRGKQPQCSVTAGTPRLARRSDDVLCVRVSVARIAPSPWPRGSIPLFKSNMTACISLPSQHSGGSEHTRPQTGRRWACKTKSTITGPLNTVRGRLTADWCTWSSDVKARRPNVSRSHVPRSLANFNFRCPLVAVCESLASDAATVDTHVGTRVRGRSRPMSADHSTADELLTAAGSELQCTALQLFSAGRPTREGGKRSLRLRDVPNYQVHSGPSVSARELAACELQPRTGFNPRPGHSWIFASENSAARCRWSTGFLGDILFPLPLYFAAAPSSPHFTLIGSQYLVVKSRPNLSTQLSHAHGHIQYGAASECKGRGKRKIPEKTSRPSASSALFSHMKSISEPSSNKTPIRLGRGRALYPPLHCGPYTGSAKSSLVESDVVSDRANSLADLKRQGKSLEHFELVNVFAPKRGLFVFCVEMKEVYGLTLDALYCNPSSFEQLLRLPSICVDGYANDIRGHPISRPVDGRGRTVVLKPHNRNTLHVIGVTAIVK
ncbi:hypothetical protein PR048_017543 [Dryococelus australis]|uniref:Uncharacterized protein n=1 Tax=Dryococelus australis TaxID=614101 RepID=A0ABQ9H9T7_9NEOP|nr:hypothetical protein PR048_017543 [Dryococelus australis]